MLLRNPARSLMPRATAPAVAVASLLTLMAAAGCNKGESPSSAPAAPSGAQTASGAAVLQSQGCARCHGMGGGGGRAPDLSHEGAKHDAAWIADQIKNPRSHNPSSRMPAYEGRISESDLKALSDYLASQK